MILDLHCHSYYSDGKHSPEFLLQLASEMQISHLAITDHDCCLAYEKYRDAANGIKLIAGVEISCAWEGREIHIVGLCIDVTNPELCNLLSSQLQQRRVRMQEMDRLLQARGKSGLWQYLEDLPCIAYTRSHVADFLVEQKISRTRQKAFESYLGRKGHIYAEPNWCSMEAAVQAISAAGGIAVLAHPGRYPLGRRKLESLVDAFNACGGEALETSYGNIQPDAKKILTELAISRNLYCSAGSDFHDDSTSWTTLGKFPQFDETAKKNAIWLHPKWHF